MSCQLVSAGKKCERTKWKYYAMLWTRYKDYLAWVRKSIFFFLLLAGKWKNEKHFSSQRKITNKSDIGGWNRERQFSKAQKEKKRLCHKTNYDFRQQQHRKNSFFLLNFRWMKLDHLWVFVGNNKVKTKCFIFFILVWDRKCGLFFDYLKWCMS